MGDLLSMPRSAPYINWEGNWWHGYLFKDSKTRLGQASYRNWCSRNRGLERQHGDDPDPFDNVFSLKTKSKYIGEEYFMPLSKAGGYYECR